MTGKERMKLAFANTGEADRVPVEPGLDFDTLTDLSGLDYWAYEDEGQLRTGTCPSCQNHPLSEEGTAGFRNSRLINATAIL